MSELKSLVMGLYHEEPEPSNTNLHEITVPRYKRLPVSIQASVADEEYHLVLELSADFQFSEDWECAYIAVLTEDGDLVRSKGIGINYFRRFSTATFGYQLRVTMDRFEIEGVKS